MKLFKKSKRMNNLGFSLVEILCAVAILGIATTAVGSAMIISAQNYSRNNVEMEVQQEAQIATNLIGELLVDAYNASATGSVLNIEGDGVKYEVSLEPTTGVLSYKEIRGVDVVTGVLAENVTKFTPTVPADFKNDKNVKIDLAVKEGDKVYEATYNATARNGDVSNIPGVVETASVGLPMVVILEPGQEINIPVTYSGMSLTQMNGLIWDIPSSASSFIESSSFGVLGNGMTLKIKDTAALTGDDYFNIVVRTGKTKDDGVSPLAFASTTIKIRRVQSVNVAITNLEPANHAKEGTQYKVEATVAGYNLDETTEFFDSDAHSYKNPRYVDFKISGTPKYDIIEVYEKVDNPYLILELNDDLYSGEQIEVTAIAVHPEGVYSDAADASASPALPVSYTNEVCNKASALTSSDKAYAHVEDTESIIGQGGGSNGNGGWGGVGTGGLRRGDFQFWTVPFSDEVVAKKTALSAQYHRYWRFWEYGETEPGEDEGWMYLASTGTQEIQLQQLQSMMFDVKKSYWIQVKLVLCSTGDRNSTVLWPITDEEKVQSIHTFSLTESKIEYKTTADAAYNEYSSYIGTKASPIIVDAGVNVVIDMRTQRLNAKNLKDDIKFQVQKWNVVTQAYEDFNDLQVMRTIDESDEDHIVLDLISQNNDTYKGQKFRILTSIDYKKTEYNASTSQYSFIPGQPENVKLYDEASGDGCIYFMYKN